MCLCSVVVCGVLRLVCVCRWPSACLGTTSPCMCQLGVWGHQGGVEGGVGMSSSACLNPSQFAL